MENEMEIPIPDKEYTITPQILGVGYWAMGKDDYVKLHVPERPKPNIIILVLSTTDPNPIAINPL